MVDLDIPREELAFTPRLEAPTAGRLSPTPYNFRFTGEDGLRVTVWSSSNSSARVAVHGRMQRDDGTIAPFSQSVPVVNDRIGEVTELEIGDGYLLNLAAFSSSGTPFIGETFVSIQVIRGRGATAFVLGTLIQGHINSLQPIAWPGSPVAQSTETRGIVKVVTGTNPGAGSEISETVPSGARWALLSLTSVLATSAVAANRRPQLVIDDGFGNVYTLIAQHVTIPASDSVFATWAVGLPLETSPASGIRGAGLPSVPAWPQNTRFRTSTSSMQAGDDYSTPILVVQEWLEGQT